MSTQNVDNSQDVIDSRDIIARIEELEALKSEDPDSFDDYDDQDELDALYALSEEAEYIPDWEYGETLIRDSYFEEYAQELAEDCGMIDYSDTLSNYVDWERWARDLKQDYTPLEFGGVTYWAHS